MIPSVGRTDSSRRAIRSTAILLLLVTTVTLIDLTDTAPYALGSITWR